MGVPEDVLSEATMAPAISDAYDFALDWVNPQLRCIPSRSPISLYARAVYNFAADSLCRVALDPSGAPVYKDEMPYWQYTRDQYGVDGFVSGVLSSTGDGSTSASFSVAQSLSNLTLQDLANLKTPWGRQYLAIAQSTGTLWGRN